STMLTKATKSDPTLLDSWVGLAWVQMRAGKSKEAEDSIHAAAKIHPEESARLEGVLQEMRQRATQPAATAPTPAAMQPQTAPASGPAVHITVNLDGPPRPGAILFVLARPAGVTSGPPSAVKRLQPESFPITIDLSSADSMLGGALPDKLRIEARLDTDGDATTKDPSEPKAVQDGVSANSTVTLTLR
ncbi:MAG: hypothetical protein JOZ54_18230, partial [Acidobacteria bacterium]|nr:hypothetical protein [Acidobacteriota bacterium]